jgi:hypothetical protein
MNRTICGKIEQMIKPRIYSRITFQIYLLFLLFPKE